MTSWYFVGDFDHTVFLLQEPFVVRVRDARLRESLVKTHYRPSHSRNKAAREIQRWISGRKLRREHLH